LGAEEDRLMSVTVSGGAKLEAALRAMAAKVSNPGTLRVGFLENAKYSDGTPVAMIAAIQDFGAPAAGIPPRPFFRNMIADKKGQWPKELGDRLKADNYNAITALDGFGQQVVGDLRKSIIETNSPPLKPATIRAKGGAHGTVYNPKDASTFAAKPLIDSGFMLQSVNYELKTG
jgi:hypothetical protein